LKQPITRGLVLIGLVAVLLISGCDGGVTQQIMITLSKTTTTTTPRVNTIQPPPPVNATTSIAAGIPTTLPTPVTISLPFGSRTTETLPVPPVITTTPAITTPVTTTSVVTTVLPVNLPDRVTNFSAMALGTSEVSLSWDHSNHAKLKCYGVYRSTSKDDLYTLVAAPAETSYFDKGLDQSVVYYYYVVAIDSSDIESEKSSVISVRTATPVLLELFSREH